MTRVGQFLSLVRQDGILRAVGNRALRSTGIAQPATIFVGRTPWSAADPPVGFARQSGRPQERDQGVACRRGRLPYKPLTELGCSYAALYGRMASCSPWPERPRNSHETRDRAALCEAGYRGATVRERLAAVTIFRPCGGFAIRLSGLPLSCLEQKASSVCGARPIDNLPYGTM